MYVQMVLPDSFPDAEDINANHFRLPAFYQEEVNSQPPDYKQINRLDYDNLAGKEKSVPFYTQEEQCTCKVECGPACLNRVSKIECCGALKANEESICNLGKQ